MALKTYLWRGGLENGKEINGWGEAAKVVVWWRVVVAFLGLSTSVPTISFYRVGSTSKVRNAQI